MAKETNVAREPENWQEILDSGDEDRFQEVVRPHMDTLLRAAEHDLAYYVTQGYLHQDDLTAEEVTGEALIYAWDHRQRRPEKMSLRGWLLGSQYRVLQAMVEQTKSYREEKAISLDEPIPEEPNDPDDAVQEQFWEWYQPDIQITWEDVVPSYEPVDYEVPLSATHETFELDPDSRHVLMMHDEFEMSLPEVAFIMGNQVNETAERLQQARATLHERMVDQPLREEVTPPAPPEGSDE